MFIFDWNTDYEALKAELCGALAGILGRVKCAEPIRSFNYAGDAIAKVFKLTL